MGDSDPKRRHTRSRRSRRGCVSYSRFDGANGPALLRYVGANAIGWAINFAGLWLLVDLFGVAHEIVQGGMVLDWR